jgi:transcriptional regulator with XRE-family HTH domain
MPRKKLPEDIDERVRRLYKQGLSKHDIARLLGISRMSVWRILGGEGEAKPNIGARVTKASMSQDVDLALLKRDVEDLREALENLANVIKDLQEGYRKISLKPLQLKEDEDRLIAECPNCGASASYQIPKRAPSKFEDVIELLKQPHGDGQNCLTCPKHGPMLRDLFSSWGYELREKAKR